MKPYWKQIIVVLFLTFLYVLFNNLSLWISVDFVKELFDPAQIERSVTGRAADGDSLLQDSRAEKTEADEEIATGIYYRVKSTIKGFLIQDDPNKTLIIVCLLIFFSFVLKNIVHYGRRILLNFIEINIVVNIRNHLHKKILNLPLNYFEKRHTGELNSIVFNDVNAINNVLHTSFGQMILAPIQIIANVAILIMISWKLSLITFIIVPLSALVIIKIGQSMRRRSRRVFQQIADVVATFQEAVTGILIVKAFANEQWEVDKFRSTNREYFKKTFRERRLHYLTSPLNEVMYVTILVFLLWYGGTLVYAQSSELSAEDFVRFLLFLFTMFAPLKELSGINNIIQSGMAAAERIFAILDAPEEVYTAPDARELKELKRNIEYQNVSFRYKQDEPYVLRNINLTIKKGEMVAIVGHSGSGKTTLVNLLPRFYELQEGSITIDEIDIRKFTLQSLRQQISIVTQDTILFNDTIKANIAYGLRSISEEHIIHAAKIANAWDFIEQMENGLDTHIGEKGIRLSGGQKQRLSIARAILKNPPILILDEATSSLDTESERLVQEAIDKLLENRTVLVIAHRLSTIKNATKIVVLHKNQIEAIGDHKELYQKSFVYTNLYDNQLLSEASLEMI